MRVSILTLFPQVFTATLNLSIIGRAQDKKAVVFDILDLRQFGAGKHKSVDDRPYGGGVGMVLKADILKDALASIPGYKRKDTTVVMTSASGIPFTNKLARDFSSKHHLILICGHYEGVDQRFIDKYVDIEITIGDFVLTGGEIPAMAIIDAVVRLLPGVLKEDATRDESFEMGILEYPHYTRPEVFENQKVPEVLLSGNHKTIAEWRKDQAQKRTLKNRPDLLK